MSGGHRASTVLISGCSIAGPTLAYWLRRHGFVPTIVERSPAPRPGGQAIDVRGKALEVVERMGLLGALKAARTTMKGMSVLDRQGNEAWRTEEMTLTGGRFDSDDVEILRDELVDMLLHAVEGVEILYGDAIAGLSEDAEGVEVAFRNAAARRFDLVVGADGLHSNVRDLAFGDETPFLRDAGMGLAVFTVPNDIGLADWQVAHRSPDRGYVVYTARDNRELRVSLGFPATMRDDCRDDLPAQKRLVMQRAADFGWEFPRFLRQVDAAPDFYFGASAQVKMDRWGKGRVALVGDAAFCPSPLTGQGTSLAIVGAYVLAEALGKSPGDHAAAFASYESSMRPFVEINQALIDELPVDTAGSPGLEKAKNAIAL